MGTFDDAISVGVVSGDTDVTDSVPFLEEIEGLDKWGAIIRNDLFYCSPLAQYIFK